MASKERQHWEKPDGRWPASREANLRLFYQGGIHHRSAAPGSPLHPDHSLADQALLMQPAREYIIHETFCMRVPKLEWAWLRLLDQTSHTKQKRQ